MITELRIQNFAIIDYLELPLSDGLITFTGETGAGKSIIIDAVEVVIGGRSDATMIRAEAERATVEADFYIPKSIRPVIHALLNKEELLDDPEYITLGREIRNRGRNIARINGRAVSLALLREIGDHLVDVHGQSEHLSLLKIASHLKLLDGYAGVEKPLGAYKTTYRSLQKIRQELNTLRQSDRDAARRADLLEYQINEIANAELTVGEEAELLNERTRLANAEMLATLAQEALFAIDEGDPDSQAATDLVGQSVRALENLARTDASQTKLSEQTQSIFDSLTDIALELRSYIEEIEFNPQRLEEVEGRLDLISSLKRKYGGSIEEILAFEESAAEELDSIANAEARIEQLQKEETTMLATLAKHGEKLFAQRQKAAKQLSKAIEGQLKDLRMEQAQFGVDFQRKPDPQGVQLPDGSRVAFGPTGLDTIQFLVAPNPGEGLKPLAKIASGGEMSRLMLALKNILAKADTTPTLIFDEIDQGIGGRIGTVVGEKLWELGREHQVLCITHLPQLAAFGRQHYRVIKQIDGGRTITVVEKLEGDARLSELAQMLGDVSEGMLQSAHEIMQRVHALEKTVQ